MSSLLLHVHLIEIQSVNNADCRKSFDPATKSRDEDKFIESDFRRASDHLELCLNDTAKSKTPSNLSVCNSRIFTLRLFN